MDSSNVNDVKTGIDLAVAAYIAVTALVSFAIGHFRIFFRKKKG